MNTVSSPLDTQSFAADRQDSGPGYSIWRLAVDLSAPLLFNGEAGQWTTSVTAPGSSRAVADRPSFRTLKILTSGSVGSLSTAVTATTDGCYRFVFRGSSTTNRYVSKPDCVDVRG